jgi:hypothetical protein
MEAKMATEGNSGVPMLAFLVGGLLVLVAVIGYFMFYGGMGSGPGDDLDVNIEAPSAPSAPEINVPEIDVTPEG